MAPSSMGPDWAAIAAAGIEVRPEAVLARLAIRSCMIEHKGNILVDRCSNTNSAQAPVLAPHWDSCSGIALEDTVQGKDKAGSNKDKNNPNRDHTRTC